MNQELLRDLDTILTAADYYIKSNGRTCGPPVSRVAKSVERDHTRKERLTMDRPDDDPAPVLGHIAELFDHDLRRAEEEAALEERRPRGRRRLATRRPEDESDRENELRDEEPDASAFPASREGFLAFVDSAPMRRLLLQQPSDYKERALRFIYDKHLLKQGWLRPEDVSAWVQRVEMWRAATPEARTLMGKAVTGYATPQPRPWDHDKSLAGLEEFAKTEPMEELRRRDPSKFKDHLMDFALSIDGIRPEQVSQLRQWLDGMTPDTHPFAKALGTVGDRLTSGQQVLCENFGQALGDPEVWMQHR